MTPYRPPGVPDRDRHAGAGSGTSATLAGDLPHGLPERAAAATYQVTLGPGPSARRCARPPTARTTVTLTGLTPDTVLHRRGHGHRHRGRHRDRRQRAGGHARPAHRDRRDGDPATGRPVNVTATVNADGAGHHLQVAVSGGGSPAESTCGGTISVNVPDVQHLLRA